MTNLAKTDRQAGRQADRQIDTERNSERQRDCVRSLSFLNFNLAFKKFPKSKVRQFASIKKEQAECIICPRRGSVLSL